MSCTTRNVGRIVLPALSSIALALAGCGNLERDTQSAGYGASFGGNKGSAKKGGDTAGSSKDPGALNGQAAGSGDGGVAKSGGSEGSAAGGDGGAGSSHNTGSGADGGAKSGGSTGDGGAKQAPSGCTNDHLSHKFYRDANGDLYVCPYYLPSFPKNCQEAQQRGIPYYADSTGKAIKCHLDKS